MMNMKWSHQDDKTPPERLHLLPRGGPALSLRVEVEPENALTSEDKISTPHREYGTYRNAVGEPRGEQRTDNAEQVVEERDSARRNLSRRTTSHHGRARTIRR
jgi:hypothetical protein